MRSKMTNKTEIPGEIYLSSQFGGTGTVGFEPFAGGIKYIRADLHDARVTELLACGKRETSARKLKAEDDGVIYE